MAKTRVTLIGCGPLGVTLGHAVKAAMKDTEVVVHDKERELARNAVTAKAADREEWNLPRACDNAALVLINLPQDSVELTLKSITKDVAQGSIVCVIGGSNVLNMDLAARHLPADVAFVSSSLVLHPDRVQPGEAPTAAHLKDAMWSLAGRGSEDQMGAFAAFVESLGARTVFVDAQERDGMTLAVEAMPQVLASMLLLTVSGDAAWKERGWAAGADFAAFTAGADNIAARAQELLANKAAAVHWLNQIMRQCIVLRDAISDGDAAAVTQQLKAAAERRDKWLAEWRAGRDQGRVPVDNQQRTIMGMFIGQRMADRLGKRPNDSGRK